MHCECSKHLAAPANKAQGRSCALCRRSISDGMITCALRRYLRDAERRRRKKKERNAVDQTMVQRAPTKGAP